MVLSAHAFDGRKFAARRKDEAKKPIGRLHGFIMIHPPAAHPIKRAVGISALSEPLSDDGAVGQIGGLVWRTEISHRLVISVIAHASGPIDFRGRGATREEKPEQNCPSHAAKPTFETER